MYPARPKIEIRASFPGELLHLDSIESLRRLVDFYVKAHNEVTPHAAFEGQTPDETYCGRGDAVVVKLVGARIEARGERIKASRSWVCGACRPDLGSGAQQQ